MKYDVYVMSFSARFLKDEWSLRDRHAALAGRPSILAGIDAQKLERPQSEVERWIVALRKELATRGVSCEWREEEAVAFAERLDFGCFQGHAFAELILETVKCDALLPCEFDGYVEVPDYDGVKLRIGSLHSFASAVRTVKDSFEASPMMETLRSSPVDSVLEGDLSIFNSRYLSVQRIIAACSAASNKLLPVHII